MKNRAFTLIELLVVVLIIGILVAIAVPQYQKAVLKANLHKGIPLVESIYQAQQAYILANGNYATSFSDLDLSLPLNNSCTHYSHSEYDYYSCDFGQLGIFDDFSNIQFINAENQIAYVHFLKDYISAIDIHYEQGKRYCFAKPTNDTANSVCQSMGGEQIGNSGTTGWNYYLIK